MDSNEPGYFQRGKRRLGQNRRLPYVLARQHVVFDAMYSHQILFFRPIRNHIKNQPFGNENIIILPLLYCSVLVLVLNRKQQRHLSSWRNSFGIMQIQLRH